MRKSAWVLILFFLLLYILPLGVRPVFIPDETRYGEIPREMIVSGDWVAPRLDGVRYFEKPILGYWLVAAAIKVLGENAFATRLASALSVGLSAFLLFLVVRRMIGRSWVGLAASAIFMTSFEVLALGQINILDGPLAFFLTAAMTAFTFADTEERPRRRQIFLALFGAACGLAFLTKGFLALVLPVTIVVPFLFWEGRWKDLFRIAWTPLAAALIVALPWSIAIHFREPDFWNYFFFVEHIHRFRDPTAQHAEPIWFYLPILLAGALPWSVFLPAMAAGLRRAGTGPHRRLFRFAVCWLLGPLVFFSLSRGKLATYILPCFPALAVLASLGLYYYSERKKTSAFKIGAALLALLPLSILAGLIVVQATELSRFQLYGPGESFKTLIMAGAMAAWAALALFAGRFGDYRARVALIALAPALFLGLGSFMVPDSILAKKAPGSFFREFAEKIGPEDRLFADSEMAPAVCWFLKRTDVYVLNTPNEFAYGTSYEDSRFKMVDLDDFWAMVEAKKKEDRRLLFITPKAFESWREVRPYIVPAQTFIKGGFMLAVF